MADIRSLVFALATALALAGLAPAHAASPLFRVDPYWPKPLPNNWILGQVGGMAVDDHDDIWVFQRPRSLADDEKGATFDPPRSKCCVPAPLAPSSESVVGVTTWPTSISGMPGAIGTR